MNKLLRANFRRLLKNRLYLAGLLFAAGLGILFDVMRFLDIRKYPEQYANAGAEYQSAEGFVFSLALYVIFALVVVIGNFLGTEYSDGTIRNKIIAGHKRINIYFSNYIVCAAAGISMLLVSILATLGVGKLLLPVSYLTTGELVGSVLSQCITMLGFTAIIVLIAMLIQSKAGGSVTMLLLTMLLFVTAMTVSSRLSAPEYREEYVSSGTDETTGQITVTPEIVKNPNYIGGTRRTFYEFLNNLLPVNQFMQVMMEISDNIGTMAVYSLLTVLLSNGAGTFLFQKKDLN